MTGCGAILTGPWTPKNLLIRVHGVVSWRPRLGFPSEVIFYLQQGSLLFRFIIAGLVAGTSKLGKYSNYILQKEKKERKCVILLSESTFTNDPPDCIIKSLSALFSLILRDNL